MGGPKRRLWRKIHIGIDEQTLEIRAIEVTSSSIGDAPILPDLLNQIPPEQEIGSVTGDGAYDMIDNLMFDMDVESTMSCSKQRQHYSRERWWLRFLA